jgi:hypothetical protein
MRLFNSLPTVKRTPRGVKRVTLAFYYLYQPCLAIEPYVSSFQTVMAFKDCVFPAWHFTLARVRF